MNDTITRNGFIKGMAGGALGIAALGALSTAAHGEEAAARFVPGTYTSRQSTPYAEVEVACTFDETSLTAVSYEVVKTSEADYFQPLSATFDAFCQTIAQTGTTEGVDGVSGATFCTVAIQDGIEACTFQAYGVAAPAAKPEALNPQLDGYKSFEGDCGEVLSPIQLGSMTLSNRVIKSAGSSPWKDADGDRIPVACELYGEMARNGVSLILLPGSAVRNNGLLPGNLETEGDLKEAMHAVDPLLDVVHEAGGRVGLQVCFGGLAPSVSDSVINETPVEELDAFIENVGVSAERIKAAGFDCVEIKGASADALNGFLTRRINIREDEYGPQSIENRCRLFTRMIEKIKEVNGPDFPVGALINGVEENDATLGDNNLFITIEESKEIAKTLVASGADWIQVRVGAPGHEMNIWAPDVQHMVKDADGITGFGTMFDYSQHFEGMVDGNRSGFASFLPIVKAIKEAVDVPVGCAAYMDLRVGPDYINDAIARGELDLVYMNRSLNCDPQLVAKITRHDREDVRPCMKCMHCHDNIGSGNRAASSCRLNAANFNALGKRMPEGAAPLPAETARKVVVVGAGPAGLEAARVAAERGHRVALYEASNRLGGLMHFARGVKGDHEHFGDYFTYAAAQMDKLGVEVNLNSRLDADDVKGLGADVVVVAVGGQRERRLEENGNVPVLSPEQAFGAQNLGETVAVLGTNVQAVDFAAMLATQGKKVVMVSEDDYLDFDKGQSGWFRSYVLPYLQGKGTRIWSGAQVQAVTESGILITTDSGLEKEIAVDSIVEFYDMLPNTALAEELEAAGCEVHCVGDCNEPWNIQRAVLSGNLAARAL